MRYKIIKTQSTFILEQRVNIALEEGFTPLGGAIYSSPIWYQTLYKHPTYPFHPPDNVKV